MGIRLSRPCYDKYRRCPGWIGGGNKYAKVKRCDGGSIESDWGRKGKFNIWKFHKCSKCNVIVFPYVIRYFDPTNWKSELSSLKFRIVQWYEIRQIKKERKRNVNEDV